MSAIPLIDFMNPNPVAPERVKPTKREQLLSEVGTLLKRKRGGKTKGRSKRKERNVTEVLTQLQQLELIRLLRNLKRDRGEAPTTTRVVGGGRRVRTSFARPLGGSTGATAFRGAVDVLAEQELARKQRESEQKVIEESKRKAEEAVVAQKKAEQKQKRTETRLIEAITEEVKDKPEKARGFEKKRIPLIQRDASGALVEVKQKGTNKTKYIFVGSKNTPYDADERYIMFRQYKMEQALEKGTDDAYEEYLKTLTPEQRALATDDREALRRFGYVLSPTVSSASSVSSASIVSSQFGAREDVARDVQRNQELGGNRRERVNVPRLNLNNGIGMGFMAPVAEGDLETLTTKLKEMRQSQVPLPSPPRVQSQPSIFEGVDWSALQESPTVERKIKSDLENIDFSALETPQGSQTQRMGGPMEGTSGITPRERDKLLEQQRGLPPYKVIEEERARAPHLNIRATQEGLGEEEFIDDRVRKSSQEMEREEEEERPRRRDSKEEAKAKLKKELEKKKQKKTLKD